MYTCSYSFIFYLLCLIQSLANTIIYARMNLRGIHNDASFRPNQYNIIVIYITIT